MGFLNSHRGRNVKAQLAKKGRKEKATRRVILTISLVLIMVLMGLVVNFMTSIQSEEKSLIKRYGTRVSKKKDNHQPQYLTKISHYQDVEKERIAKRDQLSQDLKDYNFTGKNLQTFTFQDLVVATGNFRVDAFLGQGSFGKVYKGYLEKLDQVVAIKQLDLDGIQGVREFVTEVLTLSLADHPNLVKLIGFCAEGKERLLVYEYMPLGSLHDHLHDQKPLDWNTRMKIAAGAARGLMYMHERMKPPMIYRDLKSSNILLAEDYQPKLSDFGMAKVGPSGEQSHVSTRVMGTYGYCAPEYAMTGHLTFKSDIYSFGVVLLELITGRKAMERRRASKYQNIVGWARPLFRDRKNFAKMVDKKLEGRYPVQGLQQAVAIAAMCVKENRYNRPEASDLVVALNSLASVEYEPSSQNSSRRRVIVGRDKTGHSDNREIKDGEEETRHDILKEIKSGGSL